MKSTKKPIQTGLEIDVKPETDQEILNRLAEAELATIILCIRSLVEIGC